MNRKTITSVLLFVFIMLCNDLAYGDCSRVFRSIAGNDEGKVIPYLQRIIHTMGCQLTLDPKTTTHQRRLRSIEVGDIDLLGEASRLPEREAYAWFSLPYRVEQTFLIGRANNPLIDSVKHINDVARLKLRILAHDGGWFGVDLQREREIWRQQHLLISYKDPLLALRDLRLERADLMLVTDGQRIAFSADNTDIKPLPFTVHEEPVFFMFSKKTVSEAEVAQFNAAMRKESP